MRQAHLRLGALMLAAAAGLAACGGGGGETVATPAPAPAPAPAPTTEVPASARSSVAGLVDYLQQLIQGTSETGAPVFLGDAVLPASDTAEPAAIR